MRLWKDSTNAPSQCWLGGMKRVVLTGPVSRGCSDEFGFVVGARHLWCPMSYDSCVKYFDHVGGSHALLDAESQVLTGELIDGVTDLERASLPVRIELALNGPRLPRSTCPDQVLQARRGACEPYASAHAALRRVTSAGTHHGPVTMPSTWARAQACLWPQRRCAVAESFIHWRMGV